MLLFLGEEQMLINLTFCTVKPPKEMEADESLRQTERLSPKPED